LIPAAPQPHHPSVTKGISHTLGEETTPWVFGKGDDAYDVFARSI